LDNSYAAAIAALENIFGKATDAGFGSAVFHGATVAGDSVENKAVEHYKKFLGAKYNAEREQAWMSPWKNVFTRSNKGSGIVSELASITDAEAKRSVPLFTEFTSEPEAAASALASAFDHEHVKDLAVFRIGDGEAMSGLILTTIYDDLYCCSVIALMD
jgi:hypothetical protein